MTVILVWMRWSTFFTSKFDQQRDRLHRYSAFTDDSALIVGPFIYRPPSRNKKRVLKEGVCGWYYQKNSTLKKSSL